MAPKDDDMTAIELNELVKGWPVVAKPEGVEYEDGENGYRPHWTIDNNTREYCHPEHAVLLHEASGARYLDATENHWTSSKFDGGIDIVSACRSSTSEVAKKLGTGKTRIEAISAAVLAVAKEEN